MFESALNIPASISVTDITNEYSTQHISKIIDETVAEFLIETNTLSLKCINGIKTMLNSIFQKTNDIAKENALKKCRIFSECLNIKTNNFVLENAPILKKRFRMRNELPELHYGNFTLDLQTYLSIERKLNKKVDLFLKENEVIHIILFFDDAIPGNGLSTTASMFSICNFAYRVYLPDISNPSHRRHFRLLACARTFYVKFDKYLKSTQFLVEMINSHEITLDSKSYTCKVRCVTGDNLGLHTLYKCIRNFQAKGLNNCRICHVGGVAFESFTDFDEFQHLYKNSHSIESLLYYGNYCCDGFHDFNLGVLKDILTSVIREIYKMPLVNIENLSSELLNISLSTPYYNYLSSLLTPTYFEPIIKNKNIVKGTGSQLFYLTNVLYKYIVKALEISVLSLDQRNFCKDLQTILKSSLNIMYLLSEISMDTVTFIDHWKRNVNTIIKARKKYTNIQIRMSIKLHNLFHYPIMVEKLNILPYWVSTQRFEEVNGFSKKLLTSQSCRINVSKTIIRKNMILQYLQSLVMKILEEKNNISEWNYSLDCL